MTYFRLTGSSVPAVFSLVPFYVSRVEIAAQHKQILHNAMAAFEEVGQFLKVVYKYLKGCLLACTTRTHIALQGSFRVAVCFTDNLCQQGKILLCALHGVEDGCMGTP